MSTQHITITEAFLRSDQIIDRELGIKNDGDNRLAIHAPAVRGIYLPLRVTYHEGDRSPTNRSTTFVEQTKAHPTVFEFDLPRWVRRITIEAPPIPAGAQVLEAEVTEPDPEAERILASTLLDTEGGHIAVRLPAEPEAESSPTLEQVKIHHKLEEVRMFAAMGFPEISQHDGKHYSRRDARNSLVTASRMRDEMQQALAFVLGQHDINAGANRALTDRNEWQAGKITAQADTIDALTERNERQSETIAMQRAEIDKLNAELVESRAQARDAGREIEARGAEINKLTGRNEWQAGKIVEQSAEVDRLNEALEASGEQVRHLARRERRATELFQTEHAQVKELTERNERQGETIVKQAQERDDARTLNTANARRIEDMKAQIAGLEESNAAGVQHVARLEADLDEARAERDSAQTSHAHALDAHAVTGRELEDRRKMIDELASQPIITHAIAEALNGVLRLVEHEGGNADGISLVEALTLAAQQWEATREAQANSRRGWRDSDHVLEKIDRALPNIRGVDDLVQRAEKLAVWCRERDHLKAALTMSDQTITERDETIERMRERHEHDGRLNAAMRSELGSLRRELLQRTEGEPGPLLSEIAIDPNELARMGRIELNVGGGRVVFVVKHRPHPTYRHVNAPCMVSPEFAPGGIITRPRQSGKIAEAFVRGGIGGGIDAMGLIAKIAPEAALATIGVNRKTYTRTVENLRRARAEIRTLRSALRGVDRYVATALDPWRD